MELNRLTAMDASGMIARREISSTELMAATIERITQRDNVVGAWECFDPESALSKAKELDRIPPRGPLHGIPVAIKDIIDTVDLPTSYGSSIYSGNRPAWDASCVALIKACGGIIPGKTVTAELATFAPGKTTNPHNSAHTPGGSSSGSAAAVADCMVPLAIGTQTAGSVIRPASYCGTVGYKPTYGWINRVGTKVVSETLDTLGIFARTVEDAALLGSVLTGRRLLPGPKLPGIQPRIGFCRTYEWPYAAEESILAFENAWEEMRKAGVQTREVVLPEKFRNLASMQADIQACEAAMSLAFEYTTHKRLLSSKLVDLIAAGKAVSVESYDSALKHAAKCRKQLKTLFKDIDIIVTPSAPGEAPKGLSSTGDPIFNRIWTLLHVPCVNIPAYIGPNGLPVGIQAVGKSGDDRRMLAAAGWIMKRLAA